MSILGSHNSSNMNAPFFHEFKKQASFFFKEKIKTARLAFTDVTSTELLTEEATNGNPWAPDARTLKIISRSAFEVDDFWRIVAILHKRLARFDRKNWRPSYQAILVLENLLTHGPESVAEEFQCDKDAIKEMENFQHIDEKGFNWGLSVRKKSERILKLLEKGSLLKEERDRARKLTRGIEGFGSFCQRTATEHGVLQEFSPKAYGRSNSQFNDNENQKSLFPFSDDDILLDTKLEGSQQTKKAENLSSQDAFNTGNENLSQYNSHTSFKENMGPDKELHSDGYKWINTEESECLLDDEFLNSRDVVSVEVEEDHPFNDHKNLTAAGSLLSTRDEVLQAY